MHSGLKVSSACTGSNVLGFCARVGMPYYDGLTRSEAERSLEGMCACVCVERGACALLECCGLVVVHRLAGC